MFGRMRAVDDTGTFADRLILMENVVGINMPRIASVENRLKDFIKKTDDHLQRLETRIDRDIQRRRLLTEQTRTASHRGIGTIPAPTAHDDFWGLQELEITESRQTSVVLPAPSPAQSPAPHAEPSAPPDSSQALADPSQKAFAAPRCKRVQLCFST